MDQFALEPRRYLFQLEVQRTRSDDGDFVLRRSNAAVFPAIESNRDLGITDADRLRSPNRAVQIAASATALQFVLFVKRRTAGALRRIYDVQSGIFVGRDNAFVIDPGESTCP